MARSGRITLSEIAQRAETSTMAVSVVLNGARSNTRVSDATRRRIMSVAADVKYTPNAMARSLRQKRTNTIGVLFSWAGTHTIHNLYSVAVLDGVVAGAASAGYQVLLYTKPWKSADESAAAFSDQRADGVIVVAPESNSDVIEGLVELGLQVVLVSSVTSVPGVPYVAIDNAHAVSLALKHLHQLGHTKIGYAGYGRTRHSMRERHDAFFRWMGQKNLPVPEALVLADLNSGNTETNVEQIKRLLCLPDRPTAIVAANDDLAALILDVARDMNLVVPQQLSVVGFDDVLIAPLTVPKLTTIRHPLFETGQMAARLLIENIEGKNEAAAPAHIFTPELILRSSTAAAPTMPIRAVQNDSFRL